MTTRRSSDRVLRISDGRIWADLGFEPYAGLHIRNEYDFFYERTNLVAPNASFPGVIITGQPGTSVLHGVSRHLIPDSFSGRQFLLSRQRLIPPPRGRATRYIPYVSRKHIVVHKIPRV